MTQKPDIQRSLIFPTFNMESILSLYYKKFKQYLVPAAIILLGLFLAWMVGYPQINEITTSQGKIESKKKENIQLNESLTILNTLSETSIQDNFDTLNVSYPSKKDFLAIYLGLLKVSSNTQINIKAFSAKIGRLYKYKSATTGKEIAPPATKAGPLDNQLSVQVDIDSTSARDMEKFAKEISNILPIADVVTAEFGGSSGKLQLAFFFKEYDPNSYKSEIIVKDLTASEKKILEDLSGKKP